jgi:hypothetical protein
MDAVVNGRDGISISGGSGVNNEVVLGGIRLNLSRFNGRHGIFVSPGRPINTVRFDPGSGPVVFAANTALRNGQDGILIDNGVPGFGNAFISENIAEKNGQDGIDIDDIGYVLLGNRANKNAADGINAIGNADAGGNTAEKNSGCNTPGCF